MLVRIACSQKNDTVSDQIVQRMLLATAAAAAFLVHITTDRFQNCTYRTRDLQNKRSPHSQDARDFVVHVCARNLTNCRFRKFRENRKACQNL